MSQSDKKWDKKKTQEAKNIGDTVKNMEGGRKTETPVFKAKPCLCHGTKEEARSCSETLAVLGVSPPPE